MAVSPTCPMETAMQDHIQDRSVAPLLFGLSLWAMFGAVLLVSLPWPGPRIEDCRMSRTRAAAAFFVLWTAFALWAAAPVEPTRIAAILAKAAGATLVFNWIIDLWLDYQGRDRTSA